MIILESIYLLCGIFSIALFFFLKNIIWDKPHNTINLLNRDILFLKNKLEKEISTLKNSYNIQIEKINKLHEEELFNCKNGYNIQIEALQETLLSIQNLYKKEIDSLKKRLENSSDLYIQSNEFADIILSYGWKVFYKIQNSDFYFKDTSETYNTTVNNAVKLRLIDAVEKQYKYQYLIYLYPELDKLFDGAKIKSIISEQPSTTSIRTENLFEVVNLLRQNSDCASKMIYLKNRLFFLENSKSNLKAIPYMAAIMADYETYGLEHLAKELDWGYSVQRMNKVKAIREIRRDAKAMVEKNKEAQYQLSYLLNLFPALEDVIECDFSQLPIIEVSELSEYDATKDYLSKEEYNALTECERNQLALDRYQNSRKRTKWQIGRDYELYIGYQYSKQGYDVDYVGSFLKLEDLGRDLIIKKDNTILIIQCKYWSSKKQIHENHIHQLYGTVISYCIENNIDKGKVTGILVTNIQLSATAKRMASYLGIKYIENCEAGSYPCIKCNIDAKGERIYHLPFDQQYDATKITKPGEFYAMTVEEAENAGFRRAFKWFGYQ